MLKYLYSKRSLRRKILEIQDEMKRIVGPECSEAFWIDWYGSYQIDPKNLVFWICVHSDLMKERLSSDCQLMDRLRSALTFFKYPSEAVDSVRIGFESQETVDRESGGDWFVHFK